MIENLKKDLAEFDKILLFPEETNAGLLRDFCESEALKKAVEKVLILSKLEIPCCEQSNYQYRRISCEEQEYIRRLYGMYEFSNCFQMVSDSRQYGGLLNYVKTGLITREEFFQALLE